jgi:cell division protein FtsQ
MKRSFLLRRQRIARRPRNVFHRLWRLTALFCAGVLRVFLVFLILGVVSVCLVFVYNYFVSSPFFKLRQVDIRGPSPEMRRELIQACGLDQDVSLLTLDLDQVRARMEGHPWVRTAAVERRFLDTLIVEIEAEKPCAIVLLDKPYYVNRHGEIFKELDSQDLADYPIVTGLSATGEAAQEELRGVIALLEELEPMGSEVSLERLSEVHLRAGGDLSLYFKDLRAEIKLTGERQGHKLAMLRKVVAHLKQSGRIQEVIAIDLDHRDGAAVSLGRG